LTRVEKSIKKKVFVCPGGDEKRGGKLQKGYAYKERLGGELQRPGKKKEKGTWGKCLQEIFPEKRRRDSVRPLGFKQKERKTLTGGKELPKSDQ